MTVERQPLRRNERSTFRHAGVSYQWTAGKVRGTIAVFTEDDEHVGAVTQLSLPHPVWEWVRGLGQDQVDVNKGDGDG